MFVPNKHIMLLLKRYSKPLLDVVDVEGELCSDELGGTSQGWGRRGGGVGRVGRGRRSMDSRCQANSTTFGDHDAIMSCACFGVRVWRCQDAKTLEVK